MNPNARFSVITSVVCDINRCFPIKITRPIKKQGAQLHVLFALYRVEVDFHGFIVTTIKQTVKDKYTTYNKIPCDNYPLDA